MVLASALLLLFLAPLALATGHFTVRLRLSSLFTVPFRTTLSIYGVEKEVTVTGTSYVTMDYELDREHLVRDKPHLLTITTSSSDGRTTEEMELRRFARSAHTVEGGLRIIGEAVECQKNFYGPFCWVQCVTSPGDGLVCDKEGVPRCRKVGCVEQYQKKTHTIPCQNGEYNPASKTLNDHQSAEAVYSVTFETPVSTNLLILLNAFLCLVVLVVGLILIFIGLRLRSIKEEKSANVELLNEKQLANSKHSTIRDYVLIRFSPTKSDDLFNAARENAINKKIEDFDNANQSEMENPYEIV